jgi:hypothetical protein
MHCPICLLCLVGIFMKHKQGDDQLSEEEARRRFEAALRGARIVGHKQMKDLSPKRPAKRPLRKRRKRDDRHTGED